MFRKFVRGSIAATTVVGLSVLLVPAAQAQSEQQTLVTKAQATLANFVRDPDMTWIQKNLPRAKGVYGGLNLDGTAISVNNDWNKAYYGKDVLPPDIVVRGTVKNDQAKDLLAAVKAAGK